MKQRPERPLADYHIDPMQVGRDLRSAVRVHELRIRNLEHEEAVFFDNSGSILLEKRGDANSVGFSDAEAERIRRAAVFTHNHPGGRSFSLQDVAFAGTFELGELRVVTALWTHVLRPGP